MRLLQHKRFTTVLAHSPMRNNLFSLPGYYWYTQTGSSIELIGNENDSIHKRLSHVHTGA